MTDTNWTTEFHLMVGRMSNHLRKNGVTMHGVLLATEADMARYRAALPPPPTPVDQIHAKPYLELSDPTLWIDFVKPLAAQYELPLGDR